ncbi:MAG: hypothetical protein KQ78_00210 [Candidatus Izimaplasma bacterium HR2]|nr:MAG: hypothetical protein KQ78_00210 [Candidatus Izimaplasma bacterium HR2]
MINLWEISWGLINLLLDFVVLNWIFLLCACILLFLLKKLGIFKKLKKQIDINIIDFDIKGVKIRLNKTNRQAAYKIWIELVTRKIVLEFENDDIIVEIYNSWYDAFLKIRESMKEIEPYKCNLELIDISAKVLNEGLRPHLTKYQGEFRKWYKSEIVKYPDEKPQDIQKRFHKYDELVCDMLNVSKNINIYILVLEKIFKGEV